MICDEDNFIGRGPHKSADYCGFPLQQDERLFCLSCDITFYMQTLNCLSCNNSYHTCSLEPYLTGLWILQLICCHILIEIDKFLKYIFYLAIRHILSIPTLYASKIKVHQFTIHVRPLQPELINLKIIRHKKYDMQFYLPQI